MASGVKLSDAVKHAYDDIKKHQKYLYAIFVIKVDCSLKISKAVRNLWEAFKNVLAEFVR